MVFLLFLCSACSEPGTRADSTARTLQPNQSLQVIAEGEQSPGYLAIDERYLYWISAAGLRRAKLDGSDVTTLARGEFRRIAAADGDIFVTSSSAGKVYRIDRESGDSEVIGSGEYPDGVAVFDKHVYWTNGAMLLGTGSVARTSFDGKDTAILADKLAQPSGIAANGDFVYFSSASVSCTGTTPRNAAAGVCEGGGIMKLSVRDNSVETLDPGSTTSEVVLGERGVYWVTQPGTFKFASFEAHEVMQLAAAAGDGEGPIAVDSASVYLGSTQRGRVLKVSLDGGEPQPIVTDLAAIGGLAVDGKWVYVAAQDRILRVAKDGSAAQPSGPVTGPCTMPLGAADEVAATPRADVNLELLALSIDPNRVTADEDTYQRVVADMAAIRKAEPALASIQHFAQSDGRQIMLGANDLTMQSMRAGEYHAWDCLNDFYGLQNIEVDTDIPYVVITLKGTYNIVELSKLYRALPGIKSAGSNLGGDGPTICAGRNGTTYEYVVDRASGDCPAGCIDHEAHAFVSNAAGVVEARGVWNSKTGEGDRSLFTKLCD